MPPRRRRPYSRSRFLVIADHDARRFTVIGPMVDETGWLAPIEAAREAGRNVTCHMPESPSQQAIIESYTEQQGYAYTRDSIV